MTLLYRLGVRIYHGLIWLAAHFGTVRARKWLEGRRATERKIRRGKLSFGRRSAGSSAAPTPADSSKKLVWMHCASLGEWEQGRPVLRALKNRHPEWRFVLTFFSPSGYERHGAGDLTDEVLYLPHDDRTDARRWVRCLRPDLVIFVKYEFWYDHLLAIHEAKVPLFLVAGSFRPGQPFFRPWGGWWRRMLKLFDHLMVQTDRDRDLLLSAGLPSEKITVAGDPRMDRTLQLANAPFADPILEAFSEGKLTLMAGSVWPEDIVHWRKIWPDFREKIQLILAPHQLHESEIREWTTEFGAIRYTQAGPDEAGEAEVLILDTIGILSRAYRYAQLAYVGGAFRTGLHNTLEPRAYGLPVIMGPRHQKFPEAAAAIATGGAFSVATTEELREVLHQLLQKDARRAAATAQRSGTRLSAGAGARTADKILSLVTTGSRN